MDTATLFSSLGAAAAPYGTYTAPQEQAASGTGNDQGPSQQLVQANPTQASPSAAPVPPPPPSPHSAPMSNIMAAMMRGAAKVQGQEQAKAIASKQMANADKRQITLKPNPDDPGNPRITLKDFTADAINQTEGSDLQEAYNRPARQVEAKIAATQGGGQQPAAAPQQASTPAASAPTVQAPTTPPPPNHPLEQAAQMVDANLGYRVPRPWDSDIAEKLKSEDGIRQLAEEMGDQDPEAAAHQAWRQLQHGKVSAQAVQQRVANFRLQKLEDESNRIESTMAPAERAAARQQASADRKTNEDRLLKNQSDAELAAASKEKLDWLRGTDTSILPSDPQQFLAAVHSATNATWTPSDDQRALLKQQQDVNKAFLDYTDTKKDTFALGNQPTWEAAKTAFGHPLTPQQDAIGNARWQAAHTYAINKAKDESQKQEALSSRMELLNYKIEHEGDVKPVQLDESFVKNVPAPDLLNIIDRVKNPDLVLQKKESLLHGEIQERTEKAGKANTDAHAELATPEQSRRYGWQVRVADARFRAKTESDRIAAATSELQQVQAARAGRKTGSTVQPYIAPPATAAPTPNTTGLYQLEKSDAQGGQELIYYPPGKTPDPSLRLPGAPPPSPTRPAPTPAVPPVQVLPKKRTPTAPPKIGDKKTFTAGPYAGKVGTYNGSAWFVPQ